MATHDGFLISLERLFSKMEFQCLILKTSILLCPLNIHFVRLSSVALGLTFSDHHPRVLGTLFLRGTLPPALCHCDRRRVLWTFSRHAKTIPQKKT
jgi:hypothetical protein